jgi:iron complex outermembrane recepter protein
MHRRQEPLWHAILAAGLSIGLFASLSAAEVKSRFDLPAEPLAQALRDFAVQANCNISYEPSAVADLQAPAIKGEFTPADALSRILTGTRLTVVSVNEDTLRIVEKGQSTSRDGARGRAKYEDEAIRVAYAGGDTPATQPPSDSNSATPVPASSKTHDQKDLEEIVVTGTHIAGVPVASPVIEIGQEEIQRSGFQSLSDVMLSLPQNFGGGYNPGTIANNSYVNNRYNDNPAGASVPNLRGLGPGSTLSLIDGHRMASGLSGGGVDVSSIPLDAIDRIEVVTDSASSVYGSDAVAGVVNIILKKDYDGAKTNLTYGLATQGGGTENRASQLIGTSWSGGHLVAAYEYFEQDAVDASNRVFASATPGPYSLLPETRSNAFTWTLSQEFADTASAFIEGLFVRRDVNSFVTDPAVPTPFDNPSTLQRYAVTAGVDWNLWGDWKSSAFVTAAEDATQNNTQYLGPVPIGSSNNDERLIGKLGVAELNANGQVATLPTGPVRLAVGAGYRQESFSDLLGTTGGEFTQRTDGDRNIRYAFAETSLPLVSHSQRVGLNYIDLTVSARSERYSDFGEKTVPKVGLVYAPTDSIKLRSTWGRAFRAPNLNDLDSTQQLLVFDLPNPASPSGTSPVLVQNGGNPSLKPETADSLSIGMDYLSPARNLELSATFFDIRYDNRLILLPNPFAALSDPLEAAFVIRSPSAGLVQSLYNAYPPDEIVNVTGSPFNASTIAAIVDYRLINISRQTARGADLTANYKIGTVSNGGALFANVAYLDLTEQDTPQVPTQTLSGLAFYPARLRTRSGATWTLNGWSLTGTVNYLGREMNVEVEPIQSVGSWTTIDASLRYAPTLPGFLSGLRFSLAALNLFDRNPPRVLIPTTALGLHLNYDSSNTSPLGRFLSLSVSKEW